MVHSIDLLITQKSVLRATLMLVEFYNCQLHCPLVTGYSLLTVFIVVPLYAIIYVVVKSRVTQDHHFLGEY